MKLSDFKVGDRVLLDTHKGKQQKGVVICCHEHKLHVSSDGANGGLCPDHQNGHDGNTWHVDDPRWSNMIHDPDYAVAKTLKGYSYGVTHIDDPTPASAFNLFTSFSMSDLITKLKIAVKGEPSKTLITAGIENMDGSLSQEGRELVRDRLYAEWYEKNKQTLADEIKALEEKK